MQNKPPPFYKKPTPLLFLSLLSVIIFFQIQKRNKYINENREMVEAKEMANSKYVKLLDQLPVYHDSIYKIYISNFKEKSEIVFLRKDSLTKIQEKSKFFLHLYPKDTRFLSDTKSKLLAFDFDNNVSIFVFDETKYFVSSSPLPDFVIDKINTGQYGYEGNNEINWCIDKILIKESIKSVLSHNKEKIKAFE